jgi:hypothetical protein
MNLRGIPKNEIDWIYQAQDMDKWLAPLDSVMHFQIHKMRRTSRRAERILVLASGKIFCPLSYQVHQKNYAV